MNDIIIYVKYRTLSGQNTEVKIGKQNPPSLYRSLNARQVFSVSLSIWGPRVMTACVRPSETESHRVFVGILFFTSAALFGRDENFRLRQSSFVGRRVV